MSVLRFASDLAEVITVTQAAPAPGPPKKCDDRSFFDVSIYTSHLSRTHIIISSFVPMLKKLQNKKLFHPKK